MLCFKISKYGFIVIYECIYVCMYLQYINICILLSMYFFVFYLYLVSIFITGISHRGVYYGAIMCFCLLSGVV